MTALIRTVLSLALALTVSACGSSGPDPETGAAATAPQAQPGATLLGTVGTEDDPEDYEIGLTTQDGIPVEVVAAGSYTLVVSDPSRIHNFHLSGAGVDVATDVRGTGEKRFEVTFEAGEYSYTCDPHPSMSGSLRVV